MSERRQDGTWAVVAAAAVWDEQVSPKCSPLKVLTALGLWANKDGKCWPSIASIAEVVHAPKRQVRRHLAILERCGYVVRVRRRRSRKLGGGYGLNLFVLQFPPAPKLPKRTKQEVEDEGAPPSGEGENLASGDDSANAGNMALNARSLESETVGDLANGDETPHHTGVLRSTDLAFNGQSDLALNASLTNQDRTSPGRGTSPAHPRAGAREGDDAAPPLISDADANGSEVARQHERVRLQRRRELDPHGGLQGRDRQFSELLLAAQGDLARTRMLQAAYNAGEDPPPESEPIFGAVT